MSTVCVNVTLPLQSGLSPIGSPYRPGCRESGPRTASGLGKDNAPARPLAPARAPRPRPPAPRPPGQAWRPTRTHKPTHTFSRVFHIIPVLSFSFLTITMKHTHLCRGTHVLQVRNVQSSRRAQRPPSALWSRKPDSSVTAHPPKGRHALRFRASVDFPSPIV